MTILDVLTELNIEHRTEGQHKHVTQGWVGVDCPYCSPDWGRFHLGINIAHKYANCWTCGHKRLDRALAEISGKSMGFIKDLLRQVDGEGGRVKEEAPRGELVIPRGVGPLLKAHIDFLTKRRLDPEVCYKTWGMRGIGQEVNLAWRLWIPVHHRGEVISWTTRCVSSAPGQRYINAATTEESLSPKTTLYGLGFVRSVMLVCEGPLDAVLLGPGAVSTFGLGYSRAQIRLMANCPVRYVCFDAEKAAQIKAKELCRLLAPFPGKTVNIELETGKDPGECSDEELAQLRRLIQ